MRATVRDLRSHLKELLDVVSRREEVIITYRGKPCAKLVPIENIKKDELSENQLFGIWKDNNLVENVDEYMRNLRKGRF